MFFEYPQYLWLIIVIPIIGIIFFYILKKIKAPRIYFSNIGIFKKIASKKFLSFWKYLHSVLFVLISIFIIGALSTPFIYNDDNRSTKNGIDISVVLDVSLSMNATDLAPNRLEAAKDTLRSFIRNLKSDRVGFIIFAGKAFSQTPLTFDYNFLESIVNDITVRSIDQSHSELEGTAIGTAIMSSINRLTKTEIERTKIIILITDGEANKGIDPIAAAKFSQEKNIKIYTIGVGKDKNAKIPIGERFGKTLYAMDENGNFQTSKLDEKMLNDIATLSNGKYYRATDAAQLSSIYETINQLEKKEILETNNFEKYYITHFFILSALILFFIQIIIRYIFL